MKKILVGNDDGFGAPGVVALTEVLLESNQVWYALPDRDRSGSGQSLTLHRPIKVNRINDGGIVVEGTPADCIRLSLSGLCEFRPDLVVSGINSGANLGTDVLYSGTVAAAMEAVCAGVPSIAFSLNGTRYFDTAAWWVNEIIENLVLEEFPPETLLNINIPDLSLKKVLGCKLSRLGRRDFSTDMQKTLDPRGKERYWIGLPGGAVDNDPETDFSVVSEGYVSITPVVFGRLNDSSFDSVQGLLQKVLSL